MVEIFFINLWISIKKKYKSFILYIFFKKYTIMEIHNPLTEEILYYIEIRYRFFKHTYKIKHNVNQIFFGCDQDGMFKDYKQAEKVKKFISGELKYIIKPALNER